MGENGVLSEHTGDFLRLQTLWEKRSHFSLIFAAMDHLVYRDVLIERLKTGHQVARIVIGPLETPHDWLQALERAYQAGAKRAHTVLQLEPSNAAAWWRQANVLRERLADAFPAVIVVWLRAQDIETAAHQAPDLWNWREGVFNFVRAQPMLAPQLLSERFSPLIDADAQGVQQRLQEIQNYLAKSPEGTGSAAHLRLEAAQAHERLGQWDESEAAAREAAQDFFLAGNSRLAAQAKGKIADILAQRGDLDEALRIRKEEELPVYERLGDVRSVLVVRVMVAQLMFLQDQRAGGKSQAQPIADLMALALADARRLGLPEAGQIEGLQRAMGLAAV